VAVDGARGGVDVSPMAEDMTAAPVSGAPARAASAARLACVLVSHTHWDREWYRTFESFRARLVDTVDGVLDQLDADPGWSFLLDGQTIVIEDYLEVRPERAPELARACAEGRLAIGPWYVQPDSLLPSGESHVRNLLEGRRVGSPWGQVSQVAYTPDSFGHPAQFPQLFAGFGLCAFVYWRGNGTELDRLGPWWSWVAPDGTTLPARHLGGGYFAAAHLGEDVERAAERLRELGTRLAHPAVAEVLFMNGVDHALPDANTAAVCAQLAAQTGWEVRRGLLDDHVARLGPRPATPEAEYAGELVGGRVANLLPGVWSARLYLKARNRAAEAALEGWAEPWAALGRAFGCPDERPALRRAWRSLLANQAHDSIGGCSADRVHEQMSARYDSAEALAGETTARVLERLAGLGPRRRVPWRDVIDVAVWNPSPRARTDLVRFPLDPYPLFSVVDGHDDVHPLSLTSLGRPVVSVDGEPARVVSSDDPSRVRVVPGQPAWDIEFVARDVPGLGWRRYRLGAGGDVRTASGPAGAGDAASGGTSSVVAGDREQSGVAVEVRRGDDLGRRIAVGDLAVEAAADGTITLHRGKQCWPGLLGVDDVGDRGDTYDFDPVAGAPAVLRSVEVVASHYVTGVEELAVRRRLAVPASLGPSRAERSSATAEIVVDAVVRLVPGVDRADVEVTIDNRAEDHRLRLLFPTGDRSGTVLAATTFDAVWRRAGHVDDEGWAHPAPATFCHQGWVAAGGLMIGAPGLPEAELMGDGTIAITVVRAVGWLARLDLHTRPQGAGPGMPTPGAQCPGPLSVRLTLSGGARSPGECAVVAREAELGLRAVPAGDATAGDVALVGAGRPLVELSPPSLVLSALKPCERGDGVVVRVLNVGAEALTATLRCGLDVHTATMVRLDEEPLAAVGAGTDDRAGVRERDGSERVEVDGATVTFCVPAHGLRSVRLDLAPPGSRAREGRGAPVPGNPWR